MSVTFWMDLFTGTTWDEFRKAGAQVTGFTLRQSKYRERIRPGDVFLCYLTGVMRWIGALKTIGPSDDRTKIWKDHDFPTRFSVEPLVILEPELGVPMQSLEGRVQFYRGPHDKGKFKGIVRGSLRKINEADGTLILKLLEEARATPVVRPVDQKLLMRKPASLYRTAKRVGRKTVEVVVTIPEAEEDSRLNGTIGPEGVSTDHTEIEHLLLDAGASMGLDVWVARNDRSRTFQGQVLGQMPRVLDELPTQFNEATQRTIELIDVLWLRKNTIVRAFEIESTTSIYSGLLRMGDLVSLQPNIDMKLYIVAPDERREKVFNEIRRPMFSFRDKPLGDVCAYISFSQIRKTLGELKRMGALGHTTPSILDTIAEYPGK